MTLETEQARRRSREARDPVPEAREAKEAGELDEELQAAAAMERADFLVGEVKKSNKQIQNIVVHMQQVLAALRALREELALADGADTDQSVAADRERLAQLHARVAAYKEELIKMKDELLEQCTNQLQTERGLSGQVLQDKAREMVERVYREIE